MEVNPRLVCVARCANNLKALTTDFVDSFFLNSQRLGAGNMTCAKCPSSGSQTVDSLWVNTLTHRLLGNISVQEHNDENTETAPVKTTNTAQFTSTVLEAERQNARNGQTKHPHGET